jgi:hypothetical protein
MKESEMVGYLLRLVKNLRDLRLGMRKSHAIEVYLSPNAVQKFELQDLFGERR